MAKILICEDEPIVALDIKRHLLRFGYSVAGIFPSGEEALAVMGTERPDLVLMDIRLQGKLDGIAAARRIYDEFSVPVVLLTAYADEDTVARAKDSHPFGYIIKPFEERELRTAIEIALFRHAMEAKLRQSEERYRSLFEEAPSANFTAAPDGRITSANSAFAKLLSRSDEAGLVGSNLLDRFSDRSAGRSFLEGCRMGRVPPTEEWTLLARDGRTVYVLATLGLATDAAGRPVEIRGYLVDVSERRELESQLRQALKMEAIGRLAGGVAHDFNNIITAIMGYCNLLAEDLGDDKTQRDELEGIQTAARKAVNLTRQLLAFSRKQPLEPRLIDANQNLGDLEKMSRRLVSENIGLKFFLDAKRPRVSIDPGQFEQVLINLVVNAKDAVGESGSIVVETWNALSDGSSKFHGVPAGDWFVLAVRDTGVGIPADDQQRIFEPFFTTKAVEQGTGLGLSTVYAIITRLGGRISLESEVGKGTVFYVYLPVAGAAGDAAGADGADGDPDDAGSAAIETAAADPFGGAGPESPGGNSARSGCILLVEDDDYLRGLLVRILGKAGYRVLEAANPGEAILIAEREPAFLLMTDIVMPRMSGYELADRLGQARPEMRVLFMSGYHDRREGATADKFAGQAFLQKPFSHDQLMATLGQLEA
jgi:PAS domain S-box-containing protein